MISSKKGAAMVLALALVILCAAGSTLAWLTETVTKEDMKGLTDNPTLTVTAYAAQYMKNNTEHFQAREANNTFTLGNVQIALDETDITNPEGERVTGNQYSIYPGAVVMKDPIAHNTGANAAYLRGKVNVADW